MSKKTTGGLNIRLYGDGEQRAKQREILNHSRALAAISGESFRDFIFRVLEDKVKDCEGKKCLPIKNMQL